MFSVIITEKGGSQRRVEFDQNEVTIGRVTGNDIVLPKGNVSKRHSRIVFKDSRFVVVDLKSTNGTYVNGRKISSPLVVKPGDKIYIGDFIITVDDPANGASQPGIGNDDASLVSASSVDRSHSGVSSEEDASQPAPPPVMHTPVSPMQPTPAAAPRPPVPAAIASAPTPGRPHPPIGSSRPLPMPPVGTPGRPIPVPSTTASQNAPLASQGTGPNLRAFTPSGVPAFAAPPRPVPPVPKPRALETEMGDAVGDDPFHALMSRLAQDFDIFDASTESLRDPARWAAAERAIDRTLRNLVLEGVLDEGAEHTALPSAALREAVGLGVIESLLADERVREVLVSGPSHVLADRGTGLEPVEGGFSDVSMLVTVIRRLLAQAGVPFDPSRAVHEAVLPYGPHVSVILPPVAVRGPVLEIRRAPKSITMQQLVVEGALSFDMSQAIERALAAHKNIFVTGPSGAGVTSVLSAIASLVPKRERLVLVESIPDMSVDRPGLVALAAGRLGGAPSLRELVISAARLRADRLVIDDVGADELSTVLAVLAGKLGGHMVGVHATRDEDLLAPLRLLARLGGKDADALDALIARTVHLIVEVDTSRDGRHVTRLAELVHTGGKATTKTLFVWDQGFRAAT